MRRAHARYAAPTADTEATILDRHGHLVDRLARRLSARTAGAVSAEDLWSAGAMGLLDATRRFDLARDVRFETFAEHRIRGAMLDEMRRMDHLPRRLRARAESVERTRDQLCHALQREPANDELAAAAGVDLEELGAILALTDRREQSPDALEAPFPLPDEDLDRAQTIALLSSEVGRLPDRLQLLLSLHYVEGLTYREIARILEVSEPRVCQLHGEAMGKLRAGMASRS